MQDTSSQGGGNAGLPFSHHIVGNSLLKGRGKREVLMSPTPGWCSGQSGLPCVMIRAHVQISEARKGKILTLQIHYPPLIGNSSLQIKLTAYERQRLVSSAMAVACSTCPTTMPASYVREEHQSPLLVTTVRKEGEEKWKKLPPKTLYTNEPFTLVSGHTKI